MRMLLPLALAFLIIPAVAVGEEKKEAALDAGKLVGEWTFVSGVRAGEKVDKERLPMKVTFTKDMITLPVGEGMTFIMSYKVDGKATPATIDMDIKDGPVKEGKALGIVSVDDKEMKLCYVAVMSDKAKRPAKFESTKENEAFYFVLKKAK